MLRHHALRVNDRRVQMVAERIGEDVLDDLKRPSLVVALEILHVLQHKRGGLPLDSTEWLVHQNQPESFPVVPVIM